MASTIPSIACLGVIGRNNNPLHMTVFPSYDAASNSLVPARTLTQFSLILCGTLDIFAIRSATAATATTTGSSSANLSGASDASGLLLLHALDDRLAAYGYETNTGIKMVAIVDMWGRRGSLLGSSAGNPTDPGLSTAPGARSSVGGSIVGLRETDLKPVFKAMQNAFVRLLQNPFFDPDEHSPPAGQGGKKIASRRFSEDMQRIGEAWMPGVVNL